METFRKRIVETRQAEDARNNLLDDLMLKVDDMQKLMDRNCFTMVLVDGNCLNFLDEYVQQGTAGGEEAARLLSRAAFDYLRHDEHFKLDYKIMIRVYANFRGLSKTYLDTGILSNATSFPDFVLGFNKAHPLFDFIDAGDHDEAASSKLKANLSLFLHNVQCKQIILGASADSGFASFLSALRISTDVSSRVRILKGPPFSSEFSHIMTKFKWTEFENVFKSDIIASKPVQYPWRHRSQDFDQRRPYEAQASTTMTTSSLVWRPRKNTDFGSSNLTIEETQLSLYNGTTVPAKRKSNQSDQQPNESSDDLLLQLYSNQPSTTSSASPSQSTLPQAGESPSPVEIENSLVSSTNELLRLSPKALDFAAVKQRAERSLGLTPKYLGRNEHDQWFLRSKAIIKEAVENWIERTDNPPPKNATWMLRYFTSSKESPSSVMKNPSSALWRTKTGRRLPTSGSNCELPSDRSSYYYVYQNSKKQRVDNPNKLHVNPSLIHALRNRKPRLCNSYHLLGSCTNDACTYDHHCVLSDPEFEGLMYLSRSQPCPAGSTCTSEKCVKGHSCPNGDDCKWGDECRLADLHGIDTTVVEG